MRTAAEFVADVPSFYSLPTAEKIAALGWYAHTHEQREVFTNADIRRLFRDVHAEAPDVSVYLPRMASKKPPVVIRQRGGYRLEGSLRRRLTESYGVHQTTVIVTTVLSELPNRVPNLEQREFLEEGLKCYRVGAFRAAIVMIWNLSYHHVLAWILGDVNRLAAFNSAISVRYPKRSDHIKTYDDFEEFKEAEVIEVIRTARLCSKNIVDILKEKLGKRNKAAHPSRVTVTQHQADDVITDLVNNVVLLLV